LIEYSIGMYDHGVLIHAARLGAREASLYWVDVTQLSSTSNPDCDQRIKHSEVSTTISAFTDRFLVSLSDQALSAVGRFPDHAVPGNVTLVAPGSTSTPTTISCVTAADPVEVSLTFVYDTPVVTALSRVLNSASENLPGLNMAAITAMRVE
ncbi:MAG: hypothetical protein JJ992_06550, partial [Planctomycetes bacterium]|nr:hypothetical protein [Planctomycetota bacterium]